MTSFAGHPARVDSQFFRTVSVITYHRFASTTGCSKFRCTWCFYCFILNSNQHNSTASTASRVVVETNNSLTVQVVRINTLGTKSDEAAAGSSISHTPSLLAHQLTFNFLSVAHTHRAPLYCHCCCFVDTSSNSGFSELRPPACLRSRASPPHPATPTPYEEEEAHRPNRMEMKTTACDTTVHITIVVIGTRRKRMMKTDDDDDGDDNAASVVDEDDADVVDEQNKQQQQSGLRVLVFVGNDDEAKKNAATATTSQKLRCCCICSSFLLIHVVINRIFIECQTRYTTQLSVCLSVRLSVCLLSLLPPRLSPFVVGIHRKPPWTHRETTATLSLSRRSRLPHHPSQPPTPSSSS